MSENNFSLIIAYTNLLKRMKLPVVELSGDLTDWNSITDFAPNIKVHEVGYKGTWPNTDFSIVKFQYQPQNKPYIEVNGQKVANIVDHYCAVYDSRERTIIDSTDGIVKSSGYYESPVGWASYRLLTEDELVTEEAKEIDLIEAELKALAEPQPVETPTVEPVISYELLPPRPMHVNQPIGARKYTFGNVKVEDDIKPTGHTYPENYNVVIAAIAHIPIGDETTGYYMDAAALGDYRTTGKVTYTIGFKPSHLSDGHVVKPKVTQTDMAQQVAQEFVEPPTIEPEFVAPPELPNTYKTTYKAFPDGPRVYVFKEDIVIPELDGRRPDKHVRAGAHEVTLAGTFEYQGAIMGKPKSDYWFAVPMTSVMTKEEKQIHDDEASGVYNDDMTLADKIALNRIKPGSHPVSLPERSLDYLGRSVNQYGRFKSFVIKNKKKGN